MVRVPSDIQQIVDAFGASTIGSVTVESDGVTVTMTRGISEVTAPVAEPAPVVAAAQPEPLPMPQPCGPTVCDFAGGHAIVSTVVGRVMEPTKKSPAVAVGDVVEEGQALLAIEVLKVAQPVVADTAGTVLAIHVVPGDVVEWGMPLVTIG